VAAGGRRLDPRELGAVFAGGAIGTLARAEVGALLTHAPGGWPWATLIVNLAGAFLLGCFATGLAPSTYRRPFLGPGLCGGLTTFSTLQLELLQMLDAARYGLAAAYALVSIAGGLSAVALAASLVRRAR
jgi:CrcB protein